MYRLLIVEDEPIERKLLQKLVETNYPELFEISVCGNGNAALEKALTEGSDILLVDINILGISGLELIRCLAEKGIGGKIIITTAYDMFSYAQQAIKYGVSSYLLKPIRDMELWESIDRCLLDLSETERRRSKETQLAETMDRLREYAGKYVFKDIREGAIQENTMSQMYGWPMDGSLNAAAVQIDFMDILEAVRMEEAIAVCTKVYKEYFQVLHMSGKNMVCMFLQIKEAGFAEEFENILWATSVGVLQEMRGLGYECRIWRTSNCSSYQQLASMMNRGEKARSLSLDDCGGWEKLLKSRVGCGSGGSLQGQGIKLQKVIRRVKEGKTEKALGILGVYFVAKEARWTGFCLLISAVLSCDENAGVTPGLAAMKHAEPLKELLIWLDGLFSNREKRTVIEEAVEIMEKEFSDPDFTQTMLAERLGLHPAYFSRLFKKKTGTNFVMALTEIRIGHAKEYLREGKNPKAVALLCGYRNPKYFYEVFSGACGVSPVQYRQMMGKL